MFLFTYIYFLFTYSYSTYSSYYVLIYVYFALRVIAFSLLRESHAVGGNWKSRRRYATMRDIFLLHSHDILFIGVVRVTTSWISEVIAWSLNEPVDRRWTILYILYFREIPDRYTVTRMWMKQSEQYRSIAVLLCLCC